MPPVEFSVFLPVRNGGKYIKQCVDSILTQTYRNLELHVLDNESTDDTVSCVSRINDSRLRLWKAPRALSMQDSWARIKDVPKKEFMTTLGHDDLFDPHFLATIMGLIERYPNASLYQTGARFINAQGKAIRPFRSVPERESAAEYLAARLTYQRDISGTGYVMRSQDYDRVGGIPPFEKLLFADDALWLSLASKSWKAADPRVSLAVRIHGASESASSPSNWPSLLLGLDQFTKFLEPFITHNEDSGHVYRTFGPEFMLRYHRNVYILALLEACQKRKRIDKEISWRIEESLAKKAPQVASHLLRSFKVKAVEFLNMSCMRSQAILLWKIYYFLRTRAS